jgi:hypothetical protein
VSNTVTLTVEGKKVSVDRAFLDMTPEQQEATVNEIRRLRSEVAALNKHIQRGG